MKETKHIFIKKDVWKKLHELKYQWEKETVSEVIKELLERLNLWEKS